MASNGIKCGPSIKRALRCDYSEFLPEEEEEEAEVTKQKGIFFFHLAKKMLPFHLSIDLEKKISFSKGV